MEKTFLSKSRGKVIWLTGLSGSGKTALAENLERRLSAQGKQVKIIDGDEVRESRHKHLDFSREGVRENNRLISHLARERSAGYDFILVPVIAPYEEDRKSNREIIGHSYLEIYVNCPLEVCIKRDIKGLYRKAKEGKITNLIGFSKENPYEPPKSPDLEVDTANFTLETSVEEILNFLKMEEIGLWKKTRMAIQAARAAGEKIMEIYQKGFETRRKAGGEEITQADLESERILKKYLAPSGLEILSEESDDNLRRLSHKKIWIVDPLDGTSDFIAHTGEFCLMIAMVEDGEAVAGVVYQPNEGVLYVAQKGKGAYKVSDGYWQKISVSEIDSSDSARAVLSRHHLLESDTAMLNRIGIKNFVQKGSAGIKAAMVACGDAEVYFATTDKIKQWDTAAPSCIVKEAGGLVTDLAGRKLDYNVEDIYHKNGILISNRKIHERVLQKGL